MIPIVSRQGHKYPRVVCDENILVTPLLRAAAADIRTLPGRHIDNATLQQADALLVRSVTQVNQALLQGTPVRFVGTATAGTDHIDHEQLAAMNVAFTAAPGANANAVVEWVLAAIAHVGYLGKVLSGWSVGIVGLGHVGRLLAARIQAVGGRVIAYDPLCADWPQTVPRGTLSAVLRQPIVSLHAALHRLPPHPSWHMISTAKLGDAAPAAFINAARGELITRDALMALAKRGSKLALDTWPSEPCVDAELLSVTALATPHIAGYSLPAKALASDRLAAALAAYWRLPLSAADVQSNRDLPLQTTATSAVEALHGWLDQTCMLARDDRGMRDACQRQGITGAEFDRMRHTYPLRRELAGQSVLLGSEQAALRSIAQAVGLQAD